MTATASGIVDERQRVSRIHRWTRAEYHKMFEMGLFGDKRVELIDGEVLEVAGMLAPHAIAVRKFNARLVRTLDENSFVIGVQMPIVVDDYSEPEPDLFVASGTEEDFSSDHPGRDRLVLVVEVADSSVSEDRSVKAGLYARAGISDYWIVNVRDRQIEVYRQPQVAPGNSSGHGYGTRLIILEGSTVAPLFAPDLKIAVSEVLPPKPHE